MVLEGATNNDSASEWDSDGQVTTDSRAIVNLEVLPRVWGLVGPVEYAAHPIYVRRLTRQLASAQEVLGRPMRQDEADALSMIYARSDQKSSFVPDVCLAIAAIEARRTRHHWGTPLGSLSSQRLFKFDPDKLLMFRGPTARMLWHLGRVAIYSWVIGTVASALMISYNNRVEAAYIARDPRLKQFMEAVGSKAKGQQSRPSQKTSVQETPGMMDSQAIQASTLFERAKAARLADQSRNRYGDDDMSPTGGAFANDLEPSDGDKGALLSDNQMQSNERRQNLATERAERGREEAAIRQEKERRQGSPEGEDVFAQLQGRATPSTGSAWDRIRQRASESLASSKSGASQQRQQTFSEQEDAQRDFDAKLDQERRGVDFGASSGRKSW